MLYIHSYWANVVDPGLALNMINVFDKYFVRIWGNKSKLNVLINVFSSPCAFPENIIKQSFGFRNSIGRLKMVFKTIFSSKVTIKLQEIVKNGCCKIKTLAFFSFF